MDRLSIVNRLRYPRAVKAVEFESTMAREGRISLPPELAGEIPEGEHIRVVVMWESAAENDLWRSAGRRRFEAAYAPEDAVYEQLMNDAPVG